MKEVKKLALEVAKKSKCHKRKVGAVLVDLSNEGTDFTILSHGFNYHPDGLACEDFSGNTVDKVIHAEINAIGNAGVLVHKKGLHMYITHAPCLDCRDIMNSLNITWEIVGEFMKFDKDKIRYDLVPVSTIHAIADILTYGAKKYKAENWRNVEDADRYIAAAMRHFEAYRSGEWLDIDVLDELNNVIIKGSNKPHLAHAITNLAFLLELEHKKN